MAQRAGRAGRAGRRRRWPCGRRGRRGGRARAASRAARRRRARRRAGRRAARPSAPRRGCPCRRRRRSPARARRRRAATASYQSPPTWPAAGSKWAVRRTPWHVREPLGQQRALERLGDPALALEQLGGLAALADELAVGADELVVELEHLLDQPLLLVDQRLADHEQLVAGAGDPQPPVGRRAPGVAAEREGPGPPAVVGGGQPALRAPRAGTARSASASATPAAAAEPLERRVGARDRRRPASARPPARRPSATSIPRSRPRPLRRGSQGPGERRRIGRVEVRPGPSATSASPPNAWPPTAISGTASSARSAATARTISGTRCASAADSATTSTPWAAASSATAEGGESAPTNSTSQPSASRKSATIRTPIECSSPSAQATSDAAVAARARVVEALGQARHQALGGRGRQVLLRDRDLRLLPAPPDLVQRGLQDLQVERADVGPGVVDQPLRRGEVARHERVDVALAELDHVREATSARIFTSHLHFLTTIRLARH